jgi:benzoate 4-monooxygenase
MAIAQLLFPLSHLALILSLVPALLTLVHFLIWLIDPHGLRSFPGPWLARFSDLWLGRVAQQGHRSEVVHEMHKKYGKLTQSDRFRFEGI